MFTFQTDYGVRQARVFEAVAKAALKYSNAHSGTPVYVYAEKGGSGTGTMVAIARHGDIEIQSPLTLDGSLFLS